MQIEEMLRSLPEESREKIVAIFRDMNQESSPKLQKQLDDRLRKLKTRLQHIRSREAALKDKLSSVIEAIGESKKHSVNQEEIRLLEDWRDELLGMLDKVNCKEVEEQRVGLSSILNKIQKRTPFIFKLMKEFGDGIKS